MKPLDSDGWLQVGAAVWVVILAVIAAFISPWLCAAVVAGAGIALVEQIRHRP